MAENNKGSKKDEAPPRAERMVTIAIPGLNQQEREQVQEALASVNADPIQTAIEEVKLDTLLPVQGQLQHHLETQLAASQYQDKSKKDLELIRNSCRAAIKRIIKRGATILGDYTHPARQIQEIKLLGVRLGRHLFDEALVTLLYRAQLEDTRLDVQIRKDAFREYFETITEMQYLFGYQQESYPLLFSKEYPLSPFLDDPEVDGLIDATRTLTFPREGLNEDVPTFDGNYREWDAFWAQFKAIVDENPRISTIIKFRRLLKALRGDAHVQLKGFRFTASNYEPAKHHLEEVYGDSERILQYMKDKVGAVLPLREDSSYPEFSSFALLAQEYMRDLIYYSPNAGYSASDIILTIRRKLPKSTISRWMAFSQETDPLQLIPKMDAFLSKEMELWRTIHLDRMGERPKMRAPTSKTDHHVLKGRTTLHNFATKAVKAERSAGYSKGRTGATPVKKDPSKMNDACLFCRGQHPSVQCRGNMNPTDRKKILLKNKRCLQCLEAGHSLIACRAPPCPDCHGPHHLLLHGAKYIPLKPKRKSSA